MIISILVALVFSAIFVVVLLWETWIFFVGTLWPFLGPSQAWWLPEFSQYFTTLSYTELLFLINKNVNLSYWIREFLLFLLALFLPSAGFLLLVTYLRKRLSWMRVLVALGILPVLISLLTLIKYQRLFWFTLPSYFQGGHGQTNIALGEELVNLTKSLHRSYKYAFFAGSDSLTIEGTSHESPYTILSLYRSSYPSFYFGSIGVNYPNEATEGIRNQYLSAVKEHHYLALDRSLIDTLDFYLCNEEKRPLLYITNKQVEGSTKIKIQTATQSPQIYCQEEHIRLEGCRFEAGKNNEFCDAY